MQKQKKESNVMFWQQKKKNKVWKIFTENGLIFPWSGFYKLHLTN